jgi:shikimate kinase
MILKLKRTPGIYLVGFMGSGKSTVGRALARELGWSFVDLDEEIERREGTPISNIFEQHGEAAFRRMESDALKERVRAVERGEPQVIALGGGAFVSDPNYTLLSNNGVSVWLDCPIEIVERRVRGFRHRPLARDPQRMRELYDARRAAYARADYTIPIEGDDARETVARILALPLF